MISTLIGWFMAFVKKRWPERVQYIKSEDCNYITRDIPSEVRVNSSLVELNYSRLSPFPDPVTLYSTSGKKISLWCTQRHTIVGNGGCFVFPEGMLLAKNYHRNRSDIILVFSRNDSVEIIAVQSGEIVTQFVKPIASKEECDQIVLMVARGHGLTSPDIRYLDVDERMSMLSKGMHCIGLREFTGFWVGEQNGKSLLQVLAGIVLPAVLIISLLYTLIQCGGVWFLQQRILSTQDHLATLQEKIHPLVKKRQRDEESNHFWTVFVENETTGLPLILAYTLISKAILAVDGQLVRWEGVKDRVTFTVLLDNASQLLDVFRREKQFQSVRFDGAVRKDRKTGREQATFSLELGRNRVVATRQSQ